MSFSLLSDCLSNSVDPSIKDKIINILRSLTVSEREVISVTKISTKIHIPYNETYEVLKRFVDCKMLTEYYIERCPNCEMVVKKYNDLSQIKEEDHTCY